MISKVIHYCWFGQGDKPDIVKKCIASWKKYCPDYEIVEWNETNIDLEMNDYVRKAYSEKKWAFLTDYIRLFIVYNYGGIYLDTDVELVKNIDCVLNNAFYFGVETSGYIATGLGFGAEKNNAVVKQMMNIYDTLYNNGSCEEIQFENCPYLNTKVLEEIYGKIIFEFEGLYLTVDGGKIYSSEFFCPKDYTTGQLFVTDNTLSIHHFEGLWIPKSIKYKEKIKKVFRSIKRALKHS